MSRRARKSAAHITLRDGRVVSVRVFDRFWDLEARGVHFTVEDDGRFHLGPRSLLSDDDLQFLSRERESLVAIFRDEVRA